MYGKNFEIHIRNDCYDAIQFGTGKEDLVLLPGLGDGMTTVRGKAMMGNVLYRKYARKYRITVISRKRNPEPGATTRSMAKDQYYAMQALGIAHAHIVGVSMGGMIAQYLAADHPQAVDRLILVSTAPSGDSLIRENIGRWIGFAEMGAYLGLMIDVTEKSHPEKYLKKLRPFYPYMGSSARKMDTGRFTLHARACASHDASDILEKIKAPTLILAGDQDRILGTEGAHLLHRFIEGSQLKIYEGQGHAIYEDEKDFSRDVLDFLSQEV